MSVISPHFIKCA